MAAGAEYGIWDCAWSFYPRIIELNFIESRKALEKISRDGPKVEEKYLLEAGTLAKRINGRGLP